VPGTICKPRELFRAMLEERLRTHTNRLIDLTRCGRLPHRGGYDVATLNALIAAARQDVADTAQALQRMAQGTYGVCERCRNDIPVGRLRAAPQARFCVPCHRTWPSSGLESLAASTVSGRRPPLGSPGP
jgi:hypothetical protein